MNEKNLKKKNAVSGEDIQLYRLFCIFGAAILGFALFRIPYATFSKVLRVGQWVALGLLVLSVGAYIYLRFVKKLDEKEKVVTTTGVAYFLIPFLFLMTTFLHMEQPIFKCQVAFGFISLFAAIYNIFKREFRLVSGVTFFTLIALYYATHTFYGAYEIALSAACKVLVFLIPALTALALLLPAKSKKLASLVTDKFGKMMTLVLCAILIVLAIVTLIVPAIFLYVMIAILAVYVILGIVCTIRLI